MTAHVLLDTSPIIAHLRGKIDLVKVLPAGCLIFTSLFTLVELEKGIHKADRPEKERGKVETFLKSVAVIMPDEETAICYGRIARDLDSMRRRIPENDLWIAAVAVEGGLKPATGDAHFDRIDGLEVLRLIW